MGRSITLKNVVQGYQPPEFISEFIFPVLPVEGSPIEIKTWGKEIFKHWSTRRAENASSNIAGTDKPGYLTVKLWPRDLVKQHDKEHAATTEVADIDNHLAKEAKYGVMMDAEFENSTRLNDITNYPTGHKITLSGTDQFSDYTNSQPIKVVDDAMFAISKKTGKRPNLMVLPEDVYRVIKWHPELAMKLTNGQTEAATVKQLQDKFDVEKIVIAKAQKLNEDTGEFDYMWSKNILLFYINTSPKPSEREMSFGYRLRQKGYPFVDNDINGVDKTKQNAQRYNDKFEDGILCAEASYIIKDAIV